jgi:hypothetical protein
VGKLVTLITTPLAPDTPVYLTPSLTGSAGFSANYTDLKTCDGDMYSFGDTEHDVLEALGQLGFSQLTTAEVSSATVPAGDVVDIRTQSGTTAIRNNVTPATPLIVVVSRGPAAPNG